MANFNDAIDFTLQNEGGFSDNPNDSGGATNFGITQETYSRFVGRPVSVEEVKAMPLQDAKTIYERSYWAPLDLNNFAYQPSATALFDMGVNLGVVTAARLAQEACCDVGINLVVDGILGATSCEKINQLGPDFMTPFHTRVVSHYEQIVANNPKDHVFLGGWMNRANKLLTLIQATSKS